MNLLKTVLVFTLMVIIAGCSNIRVNSDYDSDTNFAALKTYDWMPVPAGLGLSELDINRIKRATEKELIEKGTTRNTETPDFMIAIYFGVKDKIQIMNTGGGFGYGYRGAYMGGSVQSQQYEEGTLILDFVEAESKTMVWRGMARGKLKHLSSPEKRDKSIHKVVEKILNQFPPK